MENWSIAKRIRALVVALVTGIVVVGALAAGTTLFLNVQEDRTQKMAENVVHSKDIQEDILEARLAAVRYRRAPTDAVAEEFISNIDEIDALLSELRAGGSEIPALLEENGFLGDLPTYRDAFSKSVGHQADRDAAFGRVNDALDAAQSAVHITLNKSRNSGFADLWGHSEEALIALLEGVTAFERFLLTNSPADFEAASSGVSAANEHLVEFQQADTLSVAAEEVTAALSAIGTFWDNAQNISTAIAARKTQWDIMDEVGPRLADNLDDVVLVILSQVDAVQARSETVSMVALLLLVLVSLGISAAGGVVAWRMSRKISQEMDSAVATMSALADGNNDVDIVGTDKETELGAVARALVVFRDAALENARLAEEQAQQEEANRRAEEARKQKTIEEEEAQRIRLAEARQAMIRELRDRVGDVVEAAANGDFGQRIDADFDEQELVDMVRAINRLVENVEAGVGETARVLSRLAEGDLTDRMEGNFSGKFSDLQKNVNSTLERLDELVSEIAQQSRAVGDESSSMTEQAQELARRAEQQAASLEETSAAMEEIAASAASSAEGAKSAGDVADVASRQVDDAGKVVKSAVQAMADIKDAAARIGDIVSVIDGIAFQTNLLALNASVEAARAGSAGKGFAVVATEVRALAQRSSEASQDIKSLIEESTAQVGRGVTLVEETGTTLESIMKGVSDMAQSIQSVIATAQEQAAGVQEVTNTIGQLDTITQKNAELSDQSRDNSRRVSAKAQGMRDLVGAFSTRASGKAERPLDGLELGAA